MNLVLSFFDALYTRVTSLDSRVLIGTVLDIKKTIQTDFGYELRQQRIFRLYKELSSNTIITNLSKFDRDETLLFIPFGQPVSPPNVHLRDKISETTIEQVAQSNCSNISREDFEKFTSDDNLIWPPYRNWVREAEGLFSKINNYRALTEQNKTTIETVEMSNLMNLESELKKLIDDFEMTATKCVHMIVQWRTEPLPLENLHGKGGNKYVAGGMVIRECRNWIYQAEDVGEGDLAYKLADNELRGLNLIRGLYNGVAVPLNCIVDYYGVRFYAEALCPISERSLIYGSNTEALHIMTDRDGERAAIEIAQQLNLKKVSVTLLSSSNTVILARSLRESRETRTRSLYTIRP